MVSDRYLVSANIPTGGPPVSSIRAPLSPSSRPGGWPAFTYVMLQ